MKQAIEEKFILDVVRNYTPSKFVKMMQKYENDPEALKSAGIAYAIDQIVDLISNDVQGIHLYAMNNPAVATRIYNGIKDLL